MVTLKLAPDTPGVRVLCPTHWMVRADAFRGILDNYEILTEAWVKALDIVKDEGLYKWRSFPEFNFLHGVSLAELILCHSDNLSRTPQKNQSICCRRTSSYDYDSVAQLGGHEAQIPHRRKAPKRYEQGGTDSPHFPTTVEEFYRQIYPEALDKICTCITRRFDQPEYPTCMYHNIQELLLKAARTEDYMYMYLTELIFCNRILRF